MKNRTLPFLALFLITGLTFSACSSLRDRFTNAQPSASPVDQTSIEQIQTSTSSGSSNYSVTSTTTNRVSNDSASESAKIVIELTAINPGPEETALDLLKKNAIKVESKSYGDAGSFIVSLNDLKGDATNYWAMYVNDEYAKEAADKTILKKGDRLKFVYERITTAP